MGLITSPSGTNLGYTAEDVANKSTNVTTDGASDTKYPSVKAVKTYADALVAGLLDFKGSTDASTNPNYPAASKGDAYVISVAGKVGGGSGKNVDVGDFVIATADNAGGTEASVGTSWIVIEHNLPALAEVATSGDYDDLTNKPTLGTAAAEDVGAFETALGFTAENVANKSTNVTTDGASDTKYPSAKAVKTYVDDNAGGAVATAFEDDGSHDVDCGLLDDPSIPDGKLYTFRNVSGSTCAFSFDSGNTSFVVLDGKQQLRMKWGSAILLFVEITL